jgi:hypothetical protein
VAEDVAAARVNPHRGLVDARWVGHEDERISSLQPVRDGRPLTEDGASNGGAKSFGVRLRCSHLVAHDRASACSIP